MQKLPIGGPPGVPGISVTSDLGLALSDFAMRKISAEMMQYFRRHRLTLRNPNSIDLLNLIMRFQLPEPVIGEMVVEQRPAGVEISWHACRMSFALVGDGASAAPTETGGTVFTTGNTIGSMATLYGQGEVCSSAMDGGKLHPTGIYQLQVSRIPAVTEIRLAFLTSNGPGAARYLGAVGRGDSSDSSLEYFGDGRFQYASGNQIETRDVFLPLRFDRGSRVITSSPSSGEHGKWKITVMGTM